MEKLLESAGWIFIVLILIIACILLYKIGKYREDDSPDEKIYKDKLKKK